MINPYIMPRTSIEKLIYSEWKTELGHADFGVTDDFFLVGGSSVTALSIFSKLSLSYEVDVKSFFEEPTIENVAKNLTANEDFVKNRISAIYGEIEHKTVDPDEVAAYQEKYGDIGPLRFDSRKYRNVMLLGATGFLGVYLLREILKATDAIVSLVVRAKDHEEARHRVRNVYISYFSCADYEKYEERVNCYAGDLVKEDFGLDVIQYDNLSGEVDAIINSAALVKHMGNSNGFLDTNVGSIEQILCFAKARRLKAIHHISTIGIVFGDQPSDRGSLFTEYDYNVGQKFENNYIESKYIAEGLLFEARKEGIESNIYRLNAIMFDSETGRFQNNIEENAFFLFLKPFWELNIAPQNMGMKIEISNVDQVADAVIRLVFCGKLKNETHHVFNPNTSSIDNVFKLLGRKNDVSMTASELYQRFLGEQEGSKAHNYIVELLFNCDIIMEIVKNKLNIREDKTVDILRALDFNWNQISEEMFSKAIKHAQEVGFLG